MGCLPHRVAAHLSCDPECDTLQTACPGAARTVLMGRSASVSIAGAGQLAAVLSPPRPHTGHQGGANHRGGPGKLPSRRISGGFQFQTGLATPHCLP